MTRAIGYIRCSTDRQGDSLEQQRSKLHSYAEKQGWKTEIGPGRHPVSSAYFWYFKNPCGGAIEYFADEDFVTPKWRPRNLKVVPENFAEWALSDGLRPHGEDIKSR